MLIRVTADAPVEQYDLYIRDDKTQQIIFHSGYYPVLAPGEKGDDQTGKRDLTKDALKIAIKLKQGGDYTLLLVGVIGALDGGKPAPGATQLFWAGRVHVGGTTDVDARLLTVPQGDDADDDLWPDATDFRAHVPEAQSLYADHPELLDCYDKQVPANMPILGKDGMPLAIRAETVNPFAVELCGDGYDENCDGDADEACVDEDGDGDPRGSDCDDADPARHHATAKDPFPDPPNCCGYSLGKTGAEGLKSFVGDPLLCPAQRCGNGIDDGCRGSGANDPANDTTCFVDNDCDRYPADVDCNDNDPNIHPGAPEICGNGISESCVKINGVYVPDFGCVPCDLDGDGYQRMGGGCPDATDLHSGMIDCNDNDSGVYPGASVAAGGVEGGINVQGRGASAFKGLCRRIYEPTGLTGTAKINGPDGYLAGNADCKGAAFEGCPPVACDADGDGWPKDGSCGQVGPFDCNDDDPTIYPSAPDKCGDGVDGNCSGADTLCAGMDKDGDGYLPPSDCNDNDPKVHPFAIELCNGVDDDCDGDKDEGNPDSSGAPLLDAADKSMITSCLDDTQGECGKVRGRCVCSGAQMAGTRDPDMANRVDCPDVSAHGATLPTGSFSRCFGAGQPRPQSCTAVDIDENCDGTSSFAKGMGTDLLELNQACGLDVGPCKKGVVVGCDRSQIVSPYFGSQATPDNVHWICDGTVNPQAEVCNGIDDDCNGALPAAESDPDGDKYIGCGPCAAPLASGLLGCGDCDQTRASVHPGALEACNGIDDDCDPATSDGSQECNPMGKACCSGNGGGNTCRDLSSDTGFCGACTKSCNNNIFVNACAAGGCVCGGSGAPCPMGATASSPGSWCNAGACTTCNTSAHCGQSCTACAPNQVCKADGSGCTGCNGDNDCAATSYCVGGNCTPRKPKGGACSADRECLQTSGALYCTDGVCCDTQPSACGLCRQCNLAGSLGTCTNTPAGQESGNECTANFGGCAQDKCNGAGSCAAFDGSACSSVSCDNTGSESRTIALVCTSGTCGSTPATVQLCGDYQCSGGACLSSCASDTDCHSASKKNCWPASLGGNGQCYALGTAGDVCSGNADCNSGACVGGRCCGTTGRPPSCGNGSATTACSGTTLTTYTCSGPSYNSCTSSSTSCGGSLTCLNATSCDTACSCVTSPCTTTECASGSYCPSNGSSSCSACNTSAFCGPSCTPCTPSCSNGMISGLTCNGSSCSGGVPCLGNFDCASASSCKTSCASDADCASGYWCKAGNTCEVRINSGSNCAVVNCESAGCLQCVSGAMGATCPSGSGQQKCP